MIDTAGSGHPGGSLSAADIVAVLQVKAMRHNPQDSEWPDRDHCILCKRHASAAGTGI